LSAISDLDSRLASAGEYLALGAVAVVGAGLSIDARFPLTVGLNTMLWDALDSDLLARANVAKQLDRPDGPSKLLLGDNWDDIVVGWSPVGASAAARGRLQTQFSQLDVDRSAEPSPAHEALAHLVHRGIVQIVVSLNDTRTPTWLVVGDAESIAATTGLSGGALDGGEVDTETARIWLDEGRAPSGARGRVFTQGSVHGFDLTFAAPKSVSLLRALTDDIGKKVIVTAHRRAVEAAMAPRAARRTRLRIRAHRCAHRDG
jgi:hypothetical protein